MASTKTTALGKKYFKKSARQDYEVKLKKFLTDGVPNDKPSNKAV